MIKTPKKMTSSYDIRLDQEERVIKGRIKRISGFAEWANTVPWILGLIPVIVIGLYHTATTYYPVRRTRKKATGLYQEILEVVDVMPQRNAALMSTKFHEMRSEVELIVQKLRTFYVLRPLVKETKQLAAIFKLAEDITFKRAYPDYERSLTKEEEDKIKKLYKGWEDDWKDEKMSVYND